MDFRSLKHIVVLSRVLNYIRAADQLGLTQSALSRSIQGFEKRFGVRLFDRDRSGVHLTSVGRSFAERAAELLRETEELETMLKLSGEATTGEISYGMAPLPAKALLATSMADVFNRRPDLRTTVIVRKAESLLPMLVAEEIEFFICAEEQIPHRSPTKSVPLGWFSMSLLVRPGHPLLDHENPPHRPYPLLLADRIKRATSAAFSEHPWFAGPQHLIEDYGAAARIAGQSDAIWFSSPFAAAEEIREGRLVEAPLDAENTKIRFQMMMYSLARRSLSPAAEMLRQLYQEKILDLALGDL